MFSSNKYPYSFKITHLDKKILYFEINTILDNNHIKVIKNNGLYNVNKNKGDLIIKFNVIFPKKLLPSQKEILESVL